GAGVNHRHRDARIGEAHGDAAPHGAGADHRGAGTMGRSEEHTSELQSLTNLVCRLLLEKKKNTEDRTTLDPHRPLPTQVATADLTLLTTAPSHSSPHIPTSPLHSFFFNDTAPTEIYTLSLHDALPIWRRCQPPSPGRPHWRSTWRCRPPWCRRRSPRRRHHG